MANSLLKIFTLFDIGLYFLFVYNVLFKFGVSVGLVSSNKLNSDSSFV